MKIVDLTWPMEHGMAVYPGDPSPKLRAMFFLEREGFRESWLGFNSHTGTHVDAPAHVLAEGATLDSLPLERFCGRAAVLHCPNRTVLTMEDLAPIRAAADEAVVLLVDTGWSSKWATPDDCWDYPVLGEDLADYLIASGKRGIGLDGPSADPREDPDLTIHRKLLGAGVLLFENLRNLDQLGQGPVFFAALPLDYVKADGAPVRAAAFLEMES